MSIRPTTIAIMALGGQGGGVLAEWVVRLGELAGYRAQYTSVAGVAQRTGATIYYIELMPEAEIAKTGHEPVLALMPAPGDVDVVIASELMEGGRAITRGLVTPDRTTLIASTHRVYAIAEKSAPGDARAPSERVKEAALAQSRKFVAFDMNRCANEGGSVISAAMFGALAGSGALAIPDSVFEEVIRNSGVAVEANLRTFALARERAVSGDTPLPASPAAKDAPLAPPAAIAPLLTRIVYELPFIAQTSAREGLRRTIDFQDLAYGVLYLDRLQALAKREDDRTGASENHALINDVAKNLALWMTFEDVFRVAALKSRGSRFDRVHAEIEARPGQIVGITEFMHPRMTEVADSLPAGLSALVAPGRPLHKLLTPMFRHGRKVRTTTVGGYMLLRMVAAGRNWRRRTPRFIRENAAIEGWLERIGRALAIDYALAREVAACQRLVRGYGDTHERGSAKFETLMAEFDRDHATPKFAARLRSLRLAALADEDGSALKQVLNRE